MENLRQIWKTMEQIVESAGKELLNREESSRIRTKGYADFVTAVDMHVQSHIGEMLSEKYPEIQFMSEEKGNSSLDLSGAVWILDPVDGTTNLIRNMKMSAVSLALVENKIPVAGVIYQPYTGELFSAAKGMGAYENGVPMHVTENALLKDSIVGLGTSPYHRELGEKTFDAAKRIYAASMDIRRSGSAAMDLAYVAAGRLDGMFEMILQPWDVAAGKILVEEAGGSMTNLRGEWLDVTGPDSILATNGKIHQQLQAVIAF